MAMLIKKMTDGVGADVCIDCVGGEAAGIFVQSLTGIKMKLQGGSATALYWAINSVRKGGVVSIIGVYGTPFNALPIGNAVNKGLAPRMNQAKCQAPSSAADRAHPGRPHQAQRSDHAPGAAGASLRCASHVLQQAGQLHQDNSGTAACDG